MDWQLFLVNLYSEVQEAYESELVYHCQRFSNNTDKLVLDFSDIEVITVYLFSIIKKHHEVKRIYKYIDEHWRSWFPKLPSYKNFSMRLNNLHAIFPIFLYRLSDRFTLPEWLLEGLKDRKIESIVDTMPIVMAQGSRSYKAKVATDIANRGYCATKKMKYHGLKLTCLGVFIPQHLPKPQNLIISPAADSDITIFKEHICPTLYNMRVFADKIYNDDTLKLNLKTEQNVELLPIQKRYRGQIILNADGSTL